MDYPSMVLNFLKDPVIASLLTLTVSLYLSYVLTIRRERKLRAIERHSNDLRDLGKRWIEQIPRVWLAQNPMVSEQPLVEISIEKEFLFSDIKNHIPSDLNLLGLWEKFKEDLNEYDKKCLFLFQEILEDCIKRSELPHNPDFSKGYGLSTSFVTDIYFDIVRIAQGYEPYSLSLSTNIEKREKTYELWVHGHGLAQGSEKEMIKVKEVREEFLNELYKGTSNYISKAKQLLEDQNSLQYERDDLLRLINDFISIPMYRGECKYIRWSV